MTNPLLLPSGVVVEVEIPAPPTIVAPVPTASAVPVMPVPGPPGGVLSPEALAELVDDTSEQVIEDLDPPIDLVLLFENGLA